jgi:rubrerythrin
MQNGDKPTYKSVKDALSVARTAFAGIAPDFSAPESLAAAATAYARAAELEDSAIKYYTSLLSQVNDDSGKQILKSIIDEERKHKALMESIIEFASTPNEWLEEFGINQIDDFRLDS